MRTNKELMIEFTDTYPSKKHNIARLLCIGIDALNHKLSTKPQQGDFDLVEVGKLINVGILQNPDVIVTENLFKISMYQGDMEEQHRYLIRLESIYKKEMYRRHGVADRYRKFMNQLSEA